MPKLRSCTCSMLLLLTANKETGQKSQNHLFTVSNSEKKEDNVTTFERTKKRQMLVCCYQQRTKM